MMMSASLGTIEEHTVAYMALAENKRVDIIGHSGTEVFKYDYEKVIRKFAIQNCMTIARLCKKYGVHQRNSLLMALEKI